MKYAITILVSILFLRGLTLGGGQESSHLPLSTAAEVRELLTESEYEKWFKWDSKLFPSSKLKPNGELDSANIVTRQKFYDNYIHFVRELDCPIEDLTLCAYVLDLTSEGASRIVAITNDSIWVVLPNIKHSKTSSDNIETFVELVNELIEFGVISRLEEQSATQLATLPFLLGTVSPYRALRILNRWEDAYASDDLEFLDEHLIFEDDTAHREIQPPKSVKSEGGFLTTVYWLSQPYHFHKSSISVTQSHIELIVDEIIGQRLIPSTLEGK